MKFDIILPISLFIFITVTIFVNRRIENRIKSLFEKTKLGKYEVVFFVGILGLMVAVIAFLPSFAVQLLYLVNLSYLLASFTYVIFKKRYLALVPPLLLMALYFLFWNLVVFNIFALIFACIIIIYLNTVFSWKTVIIFAILITILDVLHVFGTGLMGQAAEKVLELRLPIVIFLPTFPLGGFIVLGLGDILFSGLLSLQMVLKMGVKAGIVTALTIALSLFCYEIVAFNTTYFTYFPATIIVLLGWLASMGIQRLIFRHDLATNVVNL